MTQTPTILSGKPERTQTGYFRVRLPNGEWIDEPTRMAMKIQLERKGYYHEFYCGY